MTDAPLERLRARSAALGAPLCLGVDPHPDRLPEGVGLGVSGVERFARELIQAAADQAVAVKINVAIFEAFGAAGWAALERTRADVPADHVCILDAKRGDLGTTAERYAAGLIGHLRADGVTLSPYLAEDAVEPFFSAGDALLYLLARTSNPSAVRFQELMSDGAPLYAHVARWAAERWPGGRVGLVVGGTAPGALARLREEVPGPGFLVPGVGAQGGDLEASVRACDGAWAPGLVPVSRGIADAAHGSDWAAAATAAASTLRQRMRDAVVHSTDAAIGPSAQGGS